MRNLESREHTASFDSDIDYSAEAQAVGRLQKRLRWLSLSRRTHAKHIRQQASAVLGKGFNAMPKGKQKTQASE